MERGTRGLFRGADGVQRLGVVEHEFDQRSVAEGESSSLVGLLATAAGWSAGHVEQRGTAHTHAVAEPL